MGLFLIVGCGTKVVKEPETDTKAIVPEYVIDAKELLGIPLRESEAKVRASTDFRNYMGSDISYAYPTREYGRTTPYFTETRFSPIETYTLNHKAYLALSQNIRGGEVGRVELTHSGVVSAVEAVMMLGYDPKQLIEHPVKHRNAERSDWFALIGSYFHIIEIQWFDARNLARPGKFGKVTQIRASVW
jgi:hypothetical protein